MSSALILSLSDFSLPFVIQTDVSGLAMGVVLLFDHPIAYFSKVLSSPSKGFHLHQGIICHHKCSKRWRQYLLGNFFIIQTDRRSLKELLTRVIQTPEQQIYLSKLLGHHYEIQYKPGKSNIEADALSRCYEIPTAELQLLSAPQFLFIEELLQELAQDPSYQ